MDAEFAFPIPEVWSTPNSRTFYFAGAVHAIKPDCSPELRWYEDEQAWLALEEVAYAPTRERNLAVAERVCGMALSPYRRILEMVGELHRMGYERLRAPAYEYASGAWRCPVIPAAWTLKEHGGLFTTHGIELDWISGATYSAAAGHRWGAPILAATDPGGGMGDDLQAAWSARGPAPPTTPTGGTWTRPT